jgi:adenylate kinase family enzyme
LNVKIHFVGSSGVGKSVLAQYASLRTGYPVLPSPSRAVITAEATKEAAARMSRDLDAADHVQRLIWREMLASEAKAVVAHGSFISERSLDVIAYTAHQSRICHEICSSDEFRKYVTSLQLTDRIVFFVRPERTVVEKAADGVRDPWLSWEVVCKIDGMLELMLEMYDVRYVPIRGDVLRDRYRLVEAHLAAHKLTNANENLTNDVDFRAAANGQRISA